jgi:hypothetical protein
VKLRGKTLELLFARQTLDQRLGALGQIPERAGQVHRDFDVSTLKVPPASDQAFDFSRHAITRYQTRLSANLFRQLRAGEKWPELIEIVICQFVQGLQCLVAIEQRGWQTGDGSHAVRPMRQRDGSSTR